MTALQTGVGIKPVKIDRWLQALAPGLVGGESVVCMIKATSGFGVDLVALTEARLLYAETAAHCRVRKQFMVSDMVRVEPRGMGVRVLMRDGTEAKFSPSQFRGNSDTTLIVEALNHAIANGTPPEVEAAFHQAMDLRFAQDQKIAAAKRGLWGDASVVGSRVRSKAAQTIMAHAAPGEHPWLVIGSLGAGALAAFDDRLLLVKTGLVTGAMAGALGGVRVTTFNFRDITGIEYNAGFMNGVLEVLTPSYNGTANRDFWRGTTASRNADANDPFTLSNTLPLTKAEHAQALPHLNELRKRITAAREVNVNVEVTQTPQPSATQQSTDGIADQLARLGDLHSSGILTTEEFAAAKARLLGP